MSIKETAKYRVLANAVQSSFGKTSEAKYPSHHVKAIISADNMMEFQYTTVVNFGHYNVFLEMRKKYLEEGVELIAKSMKKIEEAYTAEMKLKEKLIEPKIEPYEKPAPKSVKLKLMDNSISDSLEYLSISPYNPNKSAFFRMSALVQIS